VLHLKSYLYHICYSQHSKASVCFEEESKAIYYHAAIESFAMGLTVYIRTAEKSADLAIKTVANGQTRQYLANRFLYNIFNKHDDKKEEH